MFSQLRSGRGIKGPISDTPKAVLQEHPQLEFVDQCMMNIRSHWPSLLFENVSLMKYFSQSIFVVVYRDSIGIRYVAR